MRTSATPLYFPPTETWASIKDARSFHARFHCTCLLIARGRRHLHVVWRARRHDMPVSVPVFCDMPDWRECLLVERFRLQYGGVLHAIRAALDACLLMGRAGGCNLWAWVPHPRCTIALLALLHPLYMPLVRQ